MIIVIEGVDATGKTTLAHQLLDAHGETRRGRPMRYHHSGVSQEDALTEYAMAIRDVEWHESVVFDRLHWGEPVYGPRYREASRITPQQFHWLELLAESRGTVTVLCADSPDKVYERVRTLDDDFVHHDEDHLREVQESFITLSADAVTPVFIHTISASINPKLLTTLAERRRKRRSKILELTGGLYVGPREPDVLLVGEQVNTNDKYPITDLPFVPYPGACGHFLMTAIMRTSLRGRVGIVNAVNPDGSEIDVFMVMNALGVTNVVTLGKKPDEVLSRQGVPHGVAFHPQYVRRFYHGSVNSYAASIFVAASTHTDTTRGGWL